jgi:ubiquinone/menaquinone biosynthesis C-methylase UbiE
MQVVADIACGNGQASVDLAEHFKTLIGIDAAPQQVAEAPPAFNMRFMLGTAEATGVAPASCDLATVAQAMHWFRLPEFYAEMHRILKPKGTLAIWGYPVGRIEGGLPGDAAAQGAKEAFWGGTIGPYWDEKRALLDNMYEGMDPPAELFTNVQRHVMHMEKEWSLAQLAGYSTTWSAYATFCREKGIAKGSAEDPAVKFLQDLQKAYDTSDVNFTTKVRFPLILILATNK